MQYEGKSEHLNLGNAYFAFCSPNCRQVLEKLCKSLSLPGIPPRPSQQAANFNLASPDCVVLCVVTRGVLHMLLKSCGCCYSGTLNMLQTSSDVSQRHVERVLSLFKAFEHRIAESDWICWILFNYVQVSKSFRSSEIVALWLQGENWETDLWNLVTVRLRSHRMKSRSSCWRSQFSTFCMQNLCPSIEFQPLC